MKHIDTIDIPAFLKSVDRHPSMKGVRVVYFDGFKMHVIREGPPYCRACLETVVLREPPVDIVLREPAVAQARDSKFLTELFGVGMSCSGLVLGWVAAGIFTGAAPITGGTSLFIAVVAGTAATASLAQCISAVGRVGLEAAAPDVLDGLDNADWYKRTALVLDAISVAGAATGAAMTVRLALSLRRSTGKTMVEVLKGLSRQERRKIAEEAVRLRNPGISNGDLKAIVRAGRYPVRFTNLEIQHSIKKQLVEALAGAIDVTGSATGGTLRKGGGIVVGLARSLDTYQ